MSIYLDHHAATPTTAAARAAMEEARAHGWANPSSIHAAGRASRAILSRAREQVASAIGASAADVVLTSGGTEACNLAVLGLAGDRPRHVVTTAIEHPAIAEPIAELERAGTKVTRLSVRGGAAPSTEAVSSAITDETALVAIQLVNHETGTILPVAAYGGACAARGVPFVVDAIQALGKIPVDVLALNATVVAFASHKIGGPAGAGALWVARHAQLDSRALGGAQERGRRAGSPDVISIAGFGAACASVDERLAAMGSLAMLRDRLEAALVASGMILNATGGPRVATVVNASAQSWTGTAFVIALDLEGVHAASGAACSSGVDQPSPIVLAMHPDEPWRAKSAIRLSLGPQTTAEDVDRALEAIRRVLARRPA